MIEKKVNKEKEQEHGLFPKADLDELEEVYLGQHRTTRG